MPVNFGKAVRVWNVIAIDVINDVIRFCFEDALLFALILEKLTYLRKVDSLKK